MGVFTTRSPHRPNALGKTTVEFLERKENTIKERGLNAVDGTPVLDIKPYTPDYDSAGNAHIPYWADPELEQR